MSKFCIKHNWANESVVDKDCPYCEIAALKQFNAQLSRQRDSICYRLEEVWDIGPEVIGDIMSWEWVDQSQECVERVQAENAALKTRLNGRTYFHDNARVEEDLAEANRQIDMLVEQLNSMTNQLDKAEERLAEMTELRDIAVDNFYKYYKLWQAQCTIAAESCNEADRLESKLAESEERMISHASMLLCDKHANHWGEMNDCPVCVSEALEARCREYTELIDGAYDIIEIWYASSPAQQKWKKEWMQKARDKGANPSW